MAESTGEDVGNHDNRASHAPIGSRDAETPTARAGSEKHDSEDSAGENHDPEVEGIARGEGESPAQDSADRKANPHAYGARAAFSRSL